MISSEANPGSPEPDFKSLRETMVQKQLRSRDIRDPGVLSAMAKVPRHEFVPERLRELAYQDSPLPIGEEQTISQPYIVALMSQELRLKKECKVLEVGTGSGYQAAILGELCQEVYSIEIVQTLAERSAALLEKLGYKNIHVRAGDGYAGWPEQAPFDAIIVTAAPDHVPQPLLDQLKVGGVLVLPVGTSFQHLTRITRTETGYEQEKIVGVRFVPMTGEAQERD